ncbi:hypothetical protein SUDANB105_04420 [Streptomyces sp. enrichment culture]|uniref:transcriptional regulator n=1 Tax=Streptomyces sp. enrichment culture TaxID=1795815 RepID=UPI003F563798
MTPVGTTPPPPLPVRDRAGPRPHTVTGLSPMLSRLAAERATGVLVRERGTIHLAEGRVVHAESPAAPGLDVLLTAHGTLDAAAWREAVDRAGPGPDAGRLLVDGGRLTAGALELCHLGALYDAAYFALAPSSTPGRFRYGDPRPPGPLHPVPVAEVERATLRRRELLHRVWPDQRADNAPLTRPGPGTVPALPPRRRAVLDLVDGVRTATDIARELGRPGFHTLVDIRRLAAAGLVAPRPQPEHRPEHQPQPQPEHRLGSDPAPPPVPYPHTPTPTVTPPPPPPAEYAPPPPPHGAPLIADGFLPEVTDPDITLLKRLRDALEAL